MNKLEIEAKTKSFRSFCTDISNLPRNEHLKRLRRLIRGENTKLQSNPEELNKAELYFKNLFNNNLVQNIHKEYQWEFKKIAEKEFFTWELPCDQIQYFITTLPKY